MKTADSRLEPYRVPERRPMFTREWRLSHGAAQWLVKRHVSPNFISLVGMAGGVAAGAAWVLTLHSEFQRTGLLMVAFGIVVRGMGNLLDGMVAVAAGNASRVGELFNEVPDRIADVAILTGAGYAIGSVPVLGYWAALMSVLTAYVRAEGKAVGGPQEYCGPMAKPQRMILLLVASLFEGLTPAVWHPHIAVGGMHLGSVGLALSVIIVGGVWTICRRLKRIQDALQLPATPLE